MRKLNRHGKWDRQLTTGLCLWAAATVTLLASCRQRSISTKPNGPVTSTSTRGWEDLLAQAPHLGRIDDGFVGSDACQSCHKDQFATWHRSYHRTMTQLATPDNIVAPFDNVTLTSRQRVYHLQRRRDEFWVEMVDPEWDQFQLQKHGVWVDLDSLPDPPRVQRQVVMATGSHHMQLYWVGSGSGQRKQSIVPFVYLLDDQRWVPREDVFMRPPNAPRLVQNWSESCIKCHSTGGQPRFDTQTLLLDTRVAELGIACEMCHGPGRKHTNYYAEIDRQGPRAADRAKTRYEIVQPRDLSSVKSAQVCGQCHSIFVFTTRSKLNEWFKHGFKYRAGNDLFKTRSIVRHPAYTSGSPTSKLPPPIRSPDRKQPYWREMFWPDGMVRVSGSEYNGLLETPCYQHGAMTCLSCHSMHDSDPNDQLAAQMETDYACIQCHSTMTNNLEAHTHHPRDSAGSRCYNCHMPHTTYGLLKAIRSHQLSNPSIAESLDRIGRPNACNLCHLDKTLAWTQQQLQTWYGVKPVPLSDEQQKNSAAVRWLLKGDAGQRALVAWHMGWESAKEASGSDWLVPFLTQLMSHESYSVVRYIAARSLKRLPGFSDVTYDFIGPLEERIAAVSEVERRWHRIKPKTLDRFGAEILITEDGTVDSETIDQLRSQRDDRDLFLNE